MWLSSGIPRFDECDLQFQSYTLVYRRLALPLGANRETSDSLLLCSHFDDSIRQKLFHEAFDRAAEQTSAGANSSQVRLVTPRQQFIDAVDLVLRNPAEDNCEPSQWINAIELGGFDQRES